MPSELLKRILLIKRYPDAMPPLSNNEMVQLAEAFLTFINQNKSLEKAIKEGLIKGEPGKSPVADKDYLSAATQQRMIEEALNRFLGDTDAKLGEKAQSLEKRVTERLEALRDGVVTEAEIERAAQLARDLIELPDFDQLILTQLTANPQAVRDSLELLQGDERLDKSAIKGIEELENELNQRIGQASTMGGVSRNTVAQMIADAPGGGAVDSVNGQTGVVVLDTGDIAEDTNLYYTEARVSANTDVAANTSARHAALTVTDSTEIDFTLTGQDLTASLKAGSIDESKLDTSVNASLDLADSAIQPGDNVTELNGTAHRVLYVNGTGDVTELALGADGTFLKSNGATSAPTFATPAGSGDVSKVGTPVDGQIGVWTGDGTIEGDAALTFDTTTDTLTTVNIAPSGTVDGRDIAADGTKLDGIESGADVTDAGNVGSVNASATSKTTPVNADSFPIVNSEASNVIGRLTFTNLKAFLKTYFDSLYATLVHTHTASDITDFDTEVSNNTDVAANTAARHAALTVTDSAEIDFTLTGQDLTASIVSASINESKLDASVNASLDLADSALQPSDIASGTITARADDINFSGGSDGDVLTVQADGSLALEAPSAGSGANTALSNLASVAINTSLVSDTDNTDALGSSAIAWSDLYLGSGSVITWSTAPSTPDVTLTHSANLLTLAGGALNSPVIYSRELYIDNGAGDNVYSGFIDGDYYTKGLIYTDDIVEYRPDSGVTIDGVVLKDGLVDGLDIGAITATTTELNYTDGVTSNIQTQLDGKQPLDADLTTIAGLTATTNNFIVAVSSAWASRTPAQVRATLDLEAGTDFYSIAATDSAIDADVATHAALTATHGATGAVMGTTNTQTVSNKDISGATNTLISRTTDTSSATPTPTGGSAFNHYSLTALATAPTFAAPSGTPAEGNRLTIRIHDNGTARALGWNAIYTSTSNATLPTTTVLGKELFLGFLYDSTDSVWRLVAITAEL